MKKFFIALLPLVLIVVMVGQAKATPITIDFQDRATVTTPLSGSYGGFDWASSWITDDFGFASISVRGLNSGDSMTFEGSPAFGLLTADFAVKNAAQTTTLTVIGYDSNNAQVASNAISLTTAWQTVGFDTTFQNIEKLVFNATGSGGWDPFFMDNVKYAPTATHTPEPSTLLLLVCGLGLLGLGLRKKNKE